MHPRLGVGRPPLNTERGSAGESDGRLPRRSLNQGGDQHGPERARRRAAAQIGWRTRVGTEERAESRVLPTSFVFDMAPPAGDSRAGARPGTRRRSARDGGHGAARCTYRANRARDRRYHTPLPDSPIDQSRRRSGGTADRELRPGDVAGGARHLKRRGRCRLQSHSHSRTQRDDHQKNRVLRGIRLRLHDSVQVRHTRQLRDAPRRHPYRRLRRRRKSREYHGPELHDHGQCTTGYSRHVPTGTVRVPIPADSALQHLSTFQCGCSHQLRKR